MLFEREGEYDEHNLYYNMRCAGVDSEENDMRMSSNINENAWSRITTGLLKLIPTLGPFRKPYLW